MPLEIDNKDHCDEFIRLNELWIKEHFELEESDRKLAADPYKIVREGGHILSLVEHEKVLGVCALVKETPERFQLARMAVDPGERAKGYGGALIDAAISKAQESGAQTLYLLTNTVLAPAISLYKKHGFRVISQCRHPVYARCNITMELQLLDADTVPAAMPFLQPGNAQVCSDIKNGK